MEKAGRVEQAVAQDIAGEVSNLRPDVRFLPHLQLHEYEGLLFSDPEAFTSGIRQPNLASKIRAIRDRFPTPEDINDDPNTAASRQVLRVYPSYRKVVDGTLGAQAAGVESMRRECPHFREWVERLQSLREV